MKFLMNLWKSKKYVIGWLTPVLWSPFLFYDSPEAKCSYVVLTMITYWFLEIVPISVTSLIPVLLFPMVGVLSSNEVSRCYFNTTLMVFLGSLVAATAVEKSNLHTRMALKVILLSGTSPRRLLFGFMMTTAFLSLWISNLATVALMIPIVNAAMDKLANRRAMSITIHNPAESVTLSLDEKQRVRTNSATANANMISVSMSKRDARRLRKGILLGVCYAANIGGTGTLTGTATNLVLNAVLKKNPISFSQWFFFNIPGLCISVFFTWIFVSIFYLNVKTSKRMEMKEDRIQEAVRLQYEQLGGIRFNECAVLCLFGLMLSLWFFRNPDFMPGWTSLFSNDHNYIQDQVPAILVCILFFLIPKDPRNLTTSPPLLDWKTTQERVSWGVILLLGGGFAMAKGCEKSGLSVWISDMISHSSATLPVPLMCFILLFVAGIMTEPTSNTATCTVLLPVVKHIAQNMNVDPLYLMLPVTVVCSYATMLPVASGTNAIVFETAKMRNKDMIVPGFFVKMIATVVLFVMTHTWGAYLFDFKY